MQNQLYVIENEQMKKQTKVGKQKGINHTLVI